VLVQQAPKLPYDGERRRRSWQLREGSVSLGQHGIDLPVLRAQDVEPFPQRGVLLAQVREHARVFLVVVAVQRGVVALPLFLQRESASLGQGAARAERMLEASQIPA
jgi:hypothetical protein